MISGRIYDIQRFCTHDGPGIRTTVFFKGCPLRCQWCHNPESQKSEPEILFSGQLCIDCKGCCAVCPAGDSREILGIGGDRSVCADCMKCTAVCPSGAIKLSGKDVTANEVMAEVEKDRVFYDQSGGGVTFSGGEPFGQVQFLLQINFLLKLLRLMPILLNFS